MKKKITIIASIFILIMIAFLYVHYNNLKKHTVISIESSELRLESDPSIDLLEELGSKVTNLTSFDKNELNNNKKLEEKRKITIASDGKIILQVKMNEREYEGIVIPYVTQGNSIYSIDIEIIEEADDLFIIGDYDTLLEDSAEINSKLEWKE